MKPNKGKSLRRAITMVLLMLIGIGSATAASYVITYTDGNTTHYLGYSGSGNNVSDYTTFNATTCVWEGSNNGKWSCNGRWLRYNNGLTTATSQGNGTNFSINQNRLTYTTGSGMFSTTYYVRYSNGWQAGTSSSNAGTVTQLSALTLSVTPTSVTGLDYNLGAGPSVSQPFTVTTTFNGLPYTITASEGFKIRVKDTGNYVQSINGNTSEVTYEVIMDAGLGQGAHNGTLSVSATWGTNQQSQSVALSGTVIGPSIEATPGSIDNLQYVTGFYSLQIPKSFSVTGSVLGNKTVSVAAPANFLVSTSETTGYQSNLTLTPTDGSLNATVWVKLADNLAAQSYNGTINVTYNNSKATSATVSVSGTVSSSAIIVNPESVTGLDYMLNQGPSPARSVAVQALNLGSSLTASLSAADYTYFEIASAENGTYGQQVSLSGTDTQVQGTIWVRLKGGLDINTHTGAIAISCGTGSKTVSLTGTVSPSGSGIYDKQVILNDLEDHTWTYYSGVDATVDGGNYNSNYLGKIYSPNPRNLVITYKGGSVNNASAVAISALSGEDQNEMIYYTTLEEGTSGSYPYTVVPNPFSKRPRTNGTSGTNGFWGFAGWKIVSGGEYIQGKSNGNVLGLEEDITFVNLPYPSVNCISAIIVFEATWTQATVKTGTDAQTFTGGTYETNFWVLTGAAGTNAFTNLAQNMTISARYPDGTVSTSATTSQGVSTSSSFTGKVKLEYIPFATNNNGNVSANGRNLYLGRGITGTFGRLDCVSEDMTVNQVVRVESGKFNGINGGTNQTHASIRMVNANINSKPTRMDLVLGCDYDRAKTDNAKLEFVSSILGGGSNGFKTPAGTPLYKIFCKSGKFTSKFFNNLGVARYDETFYISSNAQDINCGLRQLEIQGGEFGSIAGGRDQGEAGKPAVCIRIKGNPIIHGSIYGGASYMASNGTRTFVITGGTINGWVAGGNNGTQQDSGEGGVLKGDTYIYVGGNAKVRRENSHTVINHASGGNVFGAGCGVNQTATSGSVQEGTNVVIADKADVQCGVYGGGAYAFSYEDKTSTIYITGGTVGGEASTIAENTTWTGNVLGGVYGGAAMNKGGSSKIFMTGGLVKRGIYGGSNLNGTLAGSSELKIMGGQVGTNAEPASVYGGGYGEPTKINGNTSVTVEGTPVIYGNVYGGGDAGDVGGNTTVTIGSKTTVDAPTINNVYGAGKGSAANVANNVTVEMNNGTILGDIYGGGEQGTVGATETNEKYIKVTMSGGVVKGYVYGGGNEGASYATTTVTMTGGSVHESVFAGAKGVQNTIYVSGLRTLNMLGGEVYGSVYGGSRNSSDGGKIVNAGGTMPAEDAVYRAFVNVTGGTIHQHVYGGGFYGKLYGSVDIYVGKQAILGANNSANANKVMPETIINPLYIHGSVYAGSNWGTFTSGDFGPATTSGYSHIYVDGTGYDNSLNEAGQLQNNYINIGMSLFGAGTSCYAGDLGHKIYVRNYGEVVMGTQVMQVETESGTQTHSVNVVVGATRTLRSIQQADNLVIENSNIRFKGEGDMTQPTNTIKYAVANVSEKMIVTKTSTLTIASVVDYIKSLYSVYYTDESHSLYNRTIDQLIANPVRLTGDAQTLYNTENVVRLEDGYSLFVRYMDGSTQKYGTFKGFFRVVANKDSESFAYSRPKLTPTESGTTQENNDDGGFLSYLAAHNDFQDNGVAGTATFQYPYSNILQRDDRIDYRIWRINFTGEPNTVRPVALTAQGAINATSEDFGSATYTVEMPAYKGDCPQTRIKITAVDFGDHASMVDAGYLNGMTDYLYYNKSDGQTTTHTTQTQPIKDEFALISAHPNTTFGLTIKPSGNLASYGTTPATNNPPAVVSHNSLAQTWVFYCDEPENGSQATSFTLNLTYSKQITVNATLSPVTLMVQRVDCNDKVIDEISVPITITTQTVLGQQIDMKTFAYFGNIVTTPNSDQSYAVKAALPTFTKPASGDFYYFWLDGVTFQPENFEAGASAGTSEAVTHTNPMNENDYQYAMTLQQAVNADGQSGWAEAEDQFSEAYDGAAYLDMTGQNKFIGRSDGRKTASIEFVTHYNSYKDGTQYMPQNGVVGTYTFKIKYAANEAGTTDVHYFNIVVQIIKKTTAEKFYIDGVKGSNTYDGRHPDEAKYNLQGVFDADYAPGDYIIVVNAVTAKNPSNALVWSNQNYNGALVKLYRYSGDHELANSANTYALAPNQGPLVKVETSMEMYGIVLDGIETWNGVEHAVLNPNTKSFSTMAPLVAVQRGDRETGGTLLMDANSQLRDNNNVGVSGGTYNTDHYKDAQGNYIPQPVICGGGAYVDAYSTLAVRGGSIIEKNMVSQTSGSENEGGAVYMDSDANNSKYAAMEVKGLVTINDNLIRLGNKAGDPAYMDNVFMKAIENHIEVRDIAAATSVGVTKNAFHEDGDLKDFTPVAVCLDNSFAQDSLNAIFARHTNFYDDQGIYFQYHNDDNPHGPNTIYFGRTWAGVVRTQPEGFTAQNIDSREELAWAISVVNGLNRQTAAPGTAFKVTADLDMNEHVWLPIGSATEPYEGAFNGDGHTIDGIRVEYLYGLGAYGMFGYLDNGASVSHTFVTSGKMEPVILSNDVTEYIGGLVGVVNSGATVEGSEAAVTMTTDSLSVIMGGLVGQNNGLIHSSMAMPTMTGFQMGGLVGENNNELLNSFSNGLYTLRGTNEYVGGLVAVNKGRVENCYPRFRNENYSDLSGYGNFGQFVGNHVSGTVKYCYAPNSGKYIAYPGTQDDFGVYSATSTPYMYKHNDNYLTFPNESAAEATYYNQVKDLGWPIMLRTLNKWVTSQTDGVGYAQWMRTSANGLNNDYPIHNLSYFTTVASDDAVVLNYKHFLADMYGKYNSIATADKPAVIYVYGDNDLTKYGDAYNHNSTYVATYIHEDVALLQAENVTISNAFVSFKMDNSFGHASSTYGGEGDLLYDWHMVSSSLDAAPIGLQTMGQTAQWCGWNSDLTPGTHYQFAQGTPGNDDAAGFFPSNVVNEGGKFDYYTFYEPAYHWINLKRASDNHWHEDGEHGKIDYHGDWRNSSILNEDKMVPGKGYMIAIDEKTFMQAHGSLNNGRVTIPLTTQSSVATLLGYNFIGNPYHAYLDFDALATQNSSLFNSYFIYDADMDGYLPYAAKTSKGAYAAEQYLHPHQGFFVIAQAEGNATFLPSMLTSEHHVSFRGEERPAFPLVNLWAKDELGRAEIVVIETGRPEVGGAKKADGLHHADCHLSASENGEKYSILFTEEGREEVPVRFKALKDGTFTLNWNTANAQFVRLILIDNIAGVQYDMLTHDSYTFTASTHDYQSRFKIVFKYIDEDTFDGEGQDNFAFFDGSEWIIKGRGVLQAVDVTGRVMYATELHNEYGTFTLPRMAAGVYVLSLTDGGENKTQKIVIK